MKKLFKYTLLVVALCALASCSSDENIGSVAEQVTDPNNGKELIAFSKDEITRASLTRAGFSQSTLVKMRVIADNSSSNKRFADATATASAEVAANHDTEHNPLNDTHSDLGVSTPKLYWDDAFGTDSKLTVWALAIPNNTNANIIPNLKKTNWTTVDGTLNPNWYTDTSVDDNDTVSVTLSTAQTVTTMADEDLVYSNNISTGGTGGRYYYNYVAGTDSWTLNSTMGDGPMQYIAKSGGKPGGKFDKGHLKFYHALSQLEVVLNEGSDFDNSANTDFKWTKNNAVASDPAQNIKLNFYNTGKFDVSAGSWSSQSGSAITQSVVTTTTAGPATVYQANAFVVPGNTLWESNDKFIEFEIDYGQYYVTGDQVAKAIRDYASTHSLTYTDFTKTEPGKKYIIKLTVSKKKIEKITAAIVDWAEVNSNPVDAQNTYPTFTFEDRRSDVRGTRLEDTDGGYQFNVYRSAYEYTTYITDTSVKNYDWQTGYGSAASKTWDETNKVWKTTDWYWPNNKTAYHFRAAGISGHTGSAPSMTINTDATADPDLDYFALASGATNGSGDYKDYIWGAPFKGNIADGANIKYDTTTGFDAQDGETHQILPAIAPMDEEINMVMFHMTSQITVNLTTTTGADKVALRSGGTNTKVEIINYYAGGRVLMGNGLVETTGSTSTPTITTAEDDASDANKGYKAESGETPAKYMGYSYGVIPQSLANVQLRITTPDGNQYYVNLATVTGAVNNANIVNPYSGTTGNYTIDSWRPGFKYTYNITLKKKDIVKITAAVVDWETVTGNNININLEN